MLPQFTLVEHLTEIRKRLIKTLIAFIAIFIYVYTKTDQLIDFILDMATKIDIHETRRASNVLSETGFSCSSSSDSSDFYVPVLAFCPPCIKEK